MQKLPITLAVITLNEEGRIRECLESAPFVSEIVVIDSFSTDKTKEIAKSCGARVLERRFTNFREQKQYAADVATQPWVLSLDADEVLSLELQNEVRNLFHSPPKLNGYRMPRLSFHLGRWIKHGGWYPDYQLRLFKKSRAGWLKDLLHEHVKVEGPVGTLKFEIMHYVFRDLEDQIDTNNRYSSLGAQVLIQKKEKFSVLKLVFKPVGKFLECYIIKKGFLDGAPGFIIALGAAQSLFLKYAKLWESQSFPSKS